MRDAGSGGFAWQPSEAFKRASNWSAFLAAENLADYEQLERKAAQDPEWFWDALIRFLDVRFVKPYARVLDLSQGLPWPQWCVGGTTNMTLSLLDRHLAAGRGGHEAIVWESEDGQQRRLSYADTATAVNRLASGLAALGLKRGDAVGVHLPMIPEVAIAYLALARLGCIVLPLFSGFGAAAIAARLNDAEAVAVITADGCLRRGRAIEMKAVLDEAAREVASLRHVVVARRLGSAVAMREGRDVWWDDVTAQGRDTFPAAELPAEHPLMIVYTSGTTGRPKGTVHTHCGVTVKTGEDFILCFDLKPSDRLMWMTDFGWLVGPLQVTAALLAGATCVLAEGTPDHPETDRLWRLIARHRVSFLGCGPTLARMMMRHGTESVAPHDLSSLRVAASTGEPWDPDSWTWIFENVLGRRGPLMNYSGGTELGGLVATNVLRPIKPASFSGPIPGTGADIVDAEGHSVGPGEVGELVMRQACIGTTRGLWRDPERYLETYWSRIPGLWVHGDWASRDADGAWFIHGRSDDTIKIAGKRTGPAEIEALLLATHRVTDAAAVALPDPVKGSALVCAVVPAAGETPGPALDAALSDAVVTGLGASFRPQRVLAVSDLPRTRNMKTMRRVIRAVLLGEPPGDLSALVNPEAVDELRGLAQPRAGAAGREG
ncbi:MAG: AMP-dependent synthetase [Bradyrhizobiaceae bacterium]|nr:MAG: AMP-dependent synthetase [Bradyrhizobiaceae bacterium]